MATAPDGLAKASVDQTISVPSPPPPAVDGPAGPWGPSGPCDPVWFHWMAVVPLGHEVPVSWRTRAWEPWIWALV